MEAYVALLRGINVGGHGKLAMADLKALCHGLGFGGVKTYIQSGNVVFTSALSATDVRSRLETALAAVMPRAVDAFIRTAAELDALVAANPFPAAAPSQLLILFLNDPPDPKVFADALGPDGEELRPIGRDLFIHYPNGMGRSKLKLPLTQTGTGRNLNTVRKLAEMTQALRRSSEAEL